MDRLVVTGLGKKLDGEYQFSVVDILSVGQPDSLTMRELHRIKVMSGVRAGEIQNAFLAGDTDLFAALAVVLMTRQGKVVNEDKVWDASPACLSFELERDDDEQEDEEDDAGPPVLTADQTPSGSGGKSSTLTLAPQATDPSPTGPDDSEKSVDSGRAISAT